MEECELVRWMLAEARLVLTVRTRVTAGDLGVLMTLKGKGAHVCV